VSGWGGGGGGRGGGYGRSWGSSDLFIDDDVYLERIKLGVTRRG
jgi:hypothetical protein